MLRMQQQFLKDVNQEFALAHVPFWNYGYNAVE